MKMKLLFLAMSTVMAVTASGAQTQHLRVSRDSFLREQYSSKEDFVAGLRNHPETLQAMAQCVGVSPDELIQYINDHAVLGTLDHSGRYTVWAMNHRTHRPYKTTVYYKEGMKVWSTPG